MKVLRGERPFRVWFRILEVILLLARVCGTTCGSLQEAEVLVLATTAAAVSLQHPVFVVSTDHKPRLKVSHEMTSFKTIPTTELSMKRYPQTVTLDHDDALTLVLVSLVRTGLDVSPQVETSVDRLAGERKRQNGQLPQCSCSSSRGT